MVKSKIIVFQINNFTPNLTGFGNEVAERSTFPFLGVIFLNVYSTFAHYTYYRTYSVFCGEALFLATVVFRVDSKKPQNQ